MREKPILFSTPMVQAILDGRKSMTRRILHGTKRQNEWINSAGWNRIIADLSYGDCKADGLCQLWLDEFGSPLTCVKMPYQPGDRLWVGETWLEYKGNYYYKADDKHKKLDALIGGKSFFKWRPSIHMPKAAARIWLEVTSVRVERLQEITEEDAIAEGCIGYPCNGPHSSAMGCGECSNTGWVGGYSPVREFSDLWDSINAKHGWETNPWVWVISFKRVNKCH